MTTTERMKPPIWFWVVSVAALLWNITGVMAYLGQAFMTEETRNTLSSDQLNLIDTTPAWVTGAFAIAVWGGLLGCIALLLRKGWARPMFALSLLGVLVQNTYFFFMTNASEIYGSVEGLIFPLIVILIAILLVFFARISIKRGWIG